jgi:hypothetical protein
MYRPVHAVVAADAFEIQAGFTQGCDRCPSTGRFRPV